jgi:2-deoxy-D-gluconate 3-dehydrogenase
MGEHALIGDLLDLRGRTALVTGGAMGIGEAIVRRLAGAGAAVLVFDHDEGAVEQAARSMAGHGLDVGTCVGDVSSTEDVERCIEEVLAWTGRIDILVNDAGIYPRQPVLTMTPDDFDRVLDVNLRGSFLTCRLAADVMVGQGDGGRIVNVTSVDALHPSTVGLAHYDASKHGLWGFTKNLARELAPHRISVNAIAPGGIATPGVARAAVVPGEGDPALPPAAVEAFTARIPMGRLGTPDEVATVALFLVSGMASYMTGSQVVVDGGYLLS